MLQLSDISHVELELSSHCNAQCPLCPRNLFGYTSNGGYAVTHLTLTNVKSILSKDFLANIKKITLEGNFGDPLMNPELIEIIQYLGVPDIEIFTNASIRDTSFWRELSKEKNVSVVFALDGLEDTNHIYRVGTDFNKIINNASAYIDGGGTAIWKFIKFDHNYHQIPKAQQRAKELGFSQFVVADHGRNSGPVFDKAGNLKHVMGDFSGATELSHYIELQNSGDILLEDISDTPAKKIDCKALRDRSIYIASTGEVYPCCYMGFSPRTFGKGRWHQAVNAQIIPLLKENNALHRPLAECIEWFSSIPSSWSKPTFEEGRLVVCNSACGINKMKCNNTA